MERDERYRKTADAIKEIRGILFRTFNGLPSDDMHIKFNLLDVFITNLASRAKIGMETDTEEALAESVELYMQGFFQGVVEAENFDLEREGGKKYLLNQLEARVKNSMSIIDREEPEF